MGMNGNRVPNTATRNRHVKTCPLPFKARQNRGSAVQLRVKKSDVQLKLSGFCLDSGVHFSPYFQSVQTKAQTTPSEAGTAPRRAPAHPRSTHDLTLLDLTAANSSFSDGEQTGFPVVSGLNTPFRTRQQSATSQAYQ